MKKLLLIVIIILMASLVDAISFEDFDLAINYSNSNNCSNTIKILDGHCHDLLEDDYKEAQCHFVLGYCYYIEFMGRQIAIWEDGTGRSGFGLKKDLILINNSIEHYNKAVNLSWSNLTDKDLRENKKSGFLTSSLFMNADNYILLKDYDNTEKMLVLLDTILSLAPDSEQVQRFKVMYNKLYSAIPKKVEVELIGNVNNVFFGLLEIKPTITLDVLGEASFDELYTEFIDLDEHKLDKINRYEIQLQDNSFIFDAKLKLNSKNAFLFPFDTLYAEIYNISPKRIRESNVDISMKNMHKELTGIGFFTKDYIKLEFKRKLSHRFKVIISEALLIIFLLLLKKRIKHLKKKSLQHKIILKDVWDLVIPILGFIITITYSFKFILNLLTIIPLIIFIQILFLIPKKVKKLKS